MGRDPVLVASVVGLQSALDAKAASSHTHAQDDVTNLVSDLAAKAIKLTEVTITDAAVSMLTNRRYVGSIASFTADRNYTLPAGTAGDVIEVQITTGDDLFELILLGATGVSINGGSAATEWSRLFISNEFIRFRCHATNDWRVEVDGRIAQTVNGYLASDLANRYTDQAYSRIPFDTLRTDNASIANATSNNWTVTPRRTGTYAVHFRAANGVSTVYKAIRVSINAVVTLLGATDGSAGPPMAVMGMFQISAGHVVFGEYYRDGGIATAAGVQSGDERNAIFFREML